MDLICVGLSHHNAPIEVRERVAFDSAEAGIFLESLRGTADEAVLLSTCNRTELYAYSPVDADALAARLDAAKSTDVFSRPESRYVHRNLDAARHLMRVACGLDSMVLGEAQILGQVEASLEIGRRADQVDALLDRLFGSAIRLGGKVRAETAIGRGAVSVGSAAVGLAIKIFGSLEGRSALVVGAGEMGTLAARHLRSAGVEDLAIANRTVVKVEALAAEVAGRGLPLCGVPAEFPNVDIVVSAVAGGEPLLTRTTLLGALKARAYRPLLLIDIAVPRSVDPEVNRLENVFLQDIDALRSIIDSSLSRRKKAAKKVAAECDAAATRFIEWTRRLSVDPTLRELRGRIDEVARRELARTLRKLPAQHHQDVENLARSLVSKFLHTPTTKLRDGAARGNGIVGRLAALREVFGLEEDHDDPDRDER